MEEHAVKAEMIFNEDRFMFVIIIWLCFLKDLKKIYFLQLLISLQNGPFKSDPVNFYYFTFIFSRLTGWVKICSAYRIIFIWDNDDALLGVQSSWQYSFTTCSHNYHLDKPPLAGNCSQSCNLTSNWKGWKPTKKRIRLWLQQQQFLNIVCDLDTLVLTRP